MFFFLVFFGGEREAPAAAAKKKKKKVEVQNDESDLKKKLCVEKVFFLSCVWRMIKGDPQAAIRML